MNVVGLDLSLTGTGVVSNSGARTIKVKVGKTWDAEHQRFAAILRSLFKEELDGDVDLVVVEGLAFASHTGKATERAGLWWMVNMECWRNDIPVAVCAPTTLKVFLVGSGRADKDTVMLASSKLYPELEVHNNNEADAKGLYLLGKQYLGEPLVDLPKTHTRAMEKVAWPDELL